MHYFIFHSSFAIIWKRKRNLVAFLILSYRCIVTINVMWPFLITPRVGLQCVIVVFPDHTHLLFKALFVFLVSRDCCLAFPYDATGVSAVFDCGIS